MPQSQPKPLPKVNQAEPVIGWKALNMVWRRPFWRIFSSYISYEIKTRDIAKCHLDEHANIPEQNCTCGFYAYKDHWNVDETAILVKVRMYGKVLEYTEGYRAEKQEILEVWFPDLMEVLHREELLEQFSEVTFHFPKAEHGTEGEKESGKQSVVITVSDARFDVLPKEVVDMLIHGSTYQMSMPGMLQAYGYLVCRWQAINQGLQLEVFDWQNMRIIGPILFTGSKERYTHQ